MKRLKTPPSPPAPPEREELRTLPRAPRLILDISRLLRFRMQQSVGELGVMKQHSARLALGHLAAHGEMSQIELARLLGLRAPTVSVLLRKMEQEGYLSRQKSQADGRTTLISLTEKGHGFDKSHLGRITEGDTLAMQGLSDEEQAQLCALLLKIRDNLQEGTGK